MANRQSVHIELNGKTVDGMMHINGNSIEVHYVDAGGTARTAYANAGPDTREEVAKNLLKEMAAEYPPK